MKTTLRTICWAGALVLAVGASAWALPLQNGNFTNDLSGWETTGAVSWADGNTVLVTAGSAVLDDYRVTLQQTFDLPTSALFLSFDFQLTADPADVIGDGAFLNVLSATLDNTSFFQVDLLNGTHDLSLNTTIEAKGTGGWYTVTADVAGLGGTSHTLYFDLFDQDQTVVTTAKIDNVAISPVSETSPVPEPATLVLLGTGLLGIARLCSAKSKTRHSQA